MNNSILKSVDKGIEYLCSKIDNGIISDFGLEVKHGASDVWTSACVGSALSKVGVYRGDILDAILGLEHSTGGWGYNKLVCADADTSLRVLQFFQNINFTDQKIIERTLKYIYKHQNYSGGIATFTNQELKLLNREERIHWSDPHLDVSALALNVLPDSIQKASLEKYVSERVKHTLQSYWWNTKFYIGYEIGVDSDIINEQSSDTISHSLKLLLLNKLGRVDNALVDILLNSQRADGSFESSRQLLIPKEKSVEAVIDDQSSLSTSAAIVALKSVFDRSIIY